MRTVRVIVEGRVQGVGFRAWVEREAARRALSGYVRNLHDGAVEAVFSGDDANVDDMLIACNRGPRLASVSKVTSAPVPEGAWDGFKVWPTA